jgi:hypothetical protein
MSIGYEHQLPIFYRRGKVNIGMEFLLLVIAGDHPAGPGSKCFMESSPFEALKYE